MRPIFGLPIYLITHAHVHYLFHHNIALNTGHYSLCGTFLLGDMGRYNYQDFLDKGDEECRFIKF